MLVSPRAALGTATILASLQQSADFFCKEVEPGRHRQEDPFLSSRSPTAETRRRERRQCRCKSCREHQPSPAELRLGGPSRPASIKVMQRTFNPLNRERYPGGPPTFAGSSNSRTSPFEGEDDGANPSPAAKSPDGETGSYLAYIQKLEARLLLGRPLHKEQTPKTNL